MERHVLSHNGSQRSGSECGSEGVLIGEMWKEAKALAPEIPEFTLLIKGTTRREITEELVKQYLSELGRLLGMKEEIPAEAWGVRGGLMAAIALEEASPLVNVWNERRVNGSSATLFKVNVDSRSPFCIRSIFNFTREFFSADQSCFVPL